MKSTTKRFGYAAAVLILLALPVASNAAPRFVITPKIAAGWGYESNFFAAEESEREVATYLIQPGIDLGIETPKSSLILNYTLDVTYYDDLESVPSGEQSADDADFLGHTFSLETRHQAFDRLLLGLDDTFYKTREPGYSDALSNAVDRDLYYINRLTPLAVYEFGPKFSIAGRYQYTVIDFDPSEREDSYEHRGILDLVYSFTPRTSLDLEYQYWEQFYDESSDYTANQAKLILRRQFRVFTFSAGAGYQNRNFDDPGFDDIDVFTYNLNITGEGLLANRKSYVGFNAEQNFNDYGPEDEYFVATRLTLRAGHRFSRKFSGDLEAFYQRSDYERTRGLTSSGDIETRKDDTYIYAGTLSYDLARWLTLSGTGGYEERRSNLAGFDYVNRFAILKLAFAYHVGRD